MKNIDRIRTLDSDALSKEQYYSQGWILTMTYQETMWIVKEIERLKNLWNRNQFDEYREVIPEGIYISDLNEMSLEQVKEIIDNYYGVYYEGDIILMKSGYFVLITYIDDADAKTLQDVKYHVVYPSGKTNIICINQIETKYDTFDGFRIIEAKLNQCCTKILHDNEKRNKIENEIPELAERYFNI